MRGIYVKKYRKKNNKVKREILNDKERKVRLFPYDNKWCASTKLVVFNCFLGLRDVQFIIKFVH